jgi:hypothetical protein
VTIFLPELLALRAHRSRQHFEPEDEGCARVGVVPVDTPSGCSVGALLRLVDAGCALSLAASLAGCCIAHTLHAAELLPTHSAVR